MLQTLKLLLPAIVPSWRFFDFIAPSPRIQFALLSAADDGPHEWHEFRPRPARLSFKKMLSRMIWNPRWNESLFLLSCAERLIENPTQHSEDEILKRITAELKKHSLATSVMTATHLQFRLLVIKRQDAQLQQSVTFQSRIQPLSGQTLK